MRKLLVVGVLALAGCATSGEGDMDTGMMADTWTAELSERNGTGVMGSARASSVWIAGHDGTTGVSVTVGRAPSGGTHPWHIHRGTCGSGGPIVGDAGAYPALRPGADGNASATANLMVGLDPAQDYYVNVHASPSDLGTIVACGELDG